METSPKYPKKLDDLLCSDLRRSVFDVIRKQSGYFTPADVVESLKAENIKVSSNMLQNLIYALVMRKVLLSFKHRTENKMGRSTLRYQLATDYNPV